MNTFHWNRENVTFLKNLSNNLNCGASSKNYGRSSWRSTQDQKMDKKLNGFWRIFLDYWVLGISEIAFAFGLSSAFLLIEKKAQFLSQKQKIRWFLNKRFHSKLTKLLLRSFHFKFFGNVNAQIVGSLSAPFQCLA